MCEFGKAVVENNSFTGGHDLWVHCRDNCNNICSNHRVAVMGRFVDGLVDRAQRQIRLGHKFDQSGKVTYYSHTDDLEDAIKRFEAFKASLQLDQTGILVGGTDAIEYRDWLCAIYWQ